MNHFLCPLSLCCILTLFPLTLSFSLAPQQLTTNTNYDYSHILISFPSTSSYTTTMTMTQENDIEDDENSYTMQSIEDQTLLSVDTCVRLNQKFLEEGKEQNQKIVFIDASWWHKGNLDGRKMFEEGPRIKDSVYMDIDDISSQFDLFPKLNPKKLPHMMPPMELFAAFMDEYNISNQDHIIIYGRESVLFTPRTWFTFRSFGHDPAKIHLMQGSLEEWIRAGGEIQEQQTTVPRAKDIIEERNISTSSHFNYIANNSPSFIYSMENVLDTVHNGIDNTKDGEENNYIVIDSRGSSYVKGNIPNSYHIPYSKLMDPNNTLKLKSENELLKVFTEVGLDPCTDNKIICSCGSGVSACTVFLALEQCGRNINEQATFMYDGSWSEWGKESNTPKVK